MANRNNYICSIKLRLPEDLKEKAQKRAKYEGKSLNGFVVGLVKRRFGIGGGRPLSRKIAEQPMLDELDADFRGNVCIDDMPNLKPSLQVGWMSLNGVNPYVRIGYDFQRSADEAHIDLSPSEAVRLLRWLQAQERLLQKLKLKQEK